MSYIDFEQEQCLLDGFSQKQAVVEVQATSTHLADGTCAPEGDILPLSSVQGLLSPCSSDKKNTELSSLSDNVIAPANVAESSDPYCGDMNVVDSSLLNTSATRVFLGPSMSWCQYENQELAMLTHLESLLLERHVQGVITREENVSVSTMISMAKLDISDMAKLATSWRKLEIPSFESQYQGILKAMQLDRLPPLPSDAKVMPVTMVFTNSAASKEEGEHSDVIEPDTVNPAPQLETQVDSLLTYHLWRMFLVFLLR